MWELTSDEAVPTAKSLVPLRCAQKPHYIEQLATNTQKRNNTRQKLPNLHTAIAPILCNIEYDVPERATWGKKIKI